VALASLPEDIRGYGHVKEAAMESVAARRETLLKDFSATVVSIGGARVA
jgi:indolepyruvate ferredoxin oxidoreductase